VHEAEQIPRNRHTTVCNPRRGERNGEGAVLIGRTDGGRLLTLVIKRTLVLTTRSSLRLDSTKAERKFVG
jgi:hypothetical protein